MNHIILYCEDCRAITNLDRSPHRRVGAKCELCGAANVLCYSWAYSRSRINRAMRELITHLNEKTKAGAAGLAAAVTDLSASTLDALDRAGATNEGEAEANDGRN